MGEYLEQYIRDVKLELNKDHMRDFWTEFGYLDENCDIASVEDLLKHVLLKYNQLSNANNV